MITASFGILHHLLKMILARDDVRTYHTLLL